MYNTGPTESISGVNNTTPRASQKSHWSSAANPGRLTDSKHARQSTYLDGSRATSGCGPDPRTCSQQAIPYNAASSNADASTGIRVATTDSDASHRSGSTSLKRAATSPNRLIPSAVAATSWSTTEVGKSPASPLASSACANSSLTANGTLNDAVIAL